MFSRRGRDVSTPLHDGGLMAKHVKYTEYVPVSEQRWRGATFFEITGDDEAKADKKLDKLFKKYLKDKPHNKEVKDV